MVYEGKEKYIFVSYAHNDADTVLPIVDALIQDGYRVWFDSGIEAGTEWPEYIEEHLMNSEVVLVFMSPSAVASRNCRNEINFALELKKEILVIYLEDTTLLKGMRLQLNSTQSLFRKHHDSYETFIRELLNARILKECRGTNAEHVVPVSAPKAPVTKSNKSRWPIYAMLGAILAALVILICVVALGGGDDPAPKADVPAGTVPVANEPLVMSDRLLDFTVEIEGEVYKFPCDYEAFTSRGWTISSSGYSDATMIAGDSYESFTMSNNGKRLLVYSYNLSGNALAIKDCPVGGAEFDAYTDVDVKLPLGITAKSTVDEVLDAYGTPNERNDQDDYVGLTYALGDSYNNSVRFTLYTSPEEQQYSYVTVKNFAENGQTQTQTNTQRPQYLDSYRTPDQLGTDFKTGIVQIQGELYQLPAPVSSFLDNGWTIVEQPSFVKAGNRDQICLKRNDSKLYVSVYNLAEYQTTPENCAVYQIEAESEQIMELLLPNGIQFGLTEEDVKLLVTEEFDFYEGSYEHSWSYMDFDGRQIYVDIAVDVETQTISAITVECATWDY